MHLATFSKSNFAQHTGFEYGHELQLGSFTFRYHAYGSFSENVFLQFGKHLVGGQDIDQLCQR